jgi:hypothetical protein
MVMTIEPGLYFRADDESLSLNAIAVSGSASRIISSSPKRGMRTSRR